MTAVAEKVRAECRGLGERATEVWTRASQVTQDASALKSAAKAVLDDATEAAGRTVASVRRHARDFEHLPEDVAYRVRRAPFRSLGGALALGMIAGATAGWLVSRLVATRDA